jgi:hypothetical protein
VVERVIERFGRLDVLVNNAGTGAAGAAEESSVAQDQRVFDINCFDAKAIQPDAPLPIYAEQRNVFDGVMARAMADGDDPAMVARAIVAAATDPRPKLRYTAGPTAGRVSALRRFVPTRVFDRQIRKLNHLPA